MVAGTQAPSAIVLEKSSRRKSGGRKLTELARECSNKEANPGGDASRNESEADEEAVSSGKRMRYARSIAD
jgi:hypothetical protein